MKQSKLLLVILSILIITSCSQPLQTPSNCMAIDNTAISSVVIAVVAYKDAEKISSIDDINYRAVDVQETGPESSIKFYLEKGMYALYYNYPDTWGGITTDGETECFILDNSTVSITLNRSGWSVQ